MTFSNEEIIFLAKTLVLINKPDLIVDDNAFNHLILAPFRPSE